MGSYHTTSNSPYQFNLFSGDQKVGALRYKSWFSQSARVRIAPDKAYRIDAGAWRRLAISIGGQEQTFRIQLKGGWNSRFILSDSDQNALVLATSKFRWKKMGYDYSFETSPAFDASTQQVLLLLTMTHAINYYLAFLAAM